MNQRACFEDMVDGCSYGVIREIGASRRLCDPTQSFDEEDKHDGRRVFLHLE